MTVRGHQLAIDWSRHGTYANPAEDVSSYVLPGDLDITYGRDVSAEGATLSATSGSMSFTLNNETQVFSPESTSSPIAGKILPNRPVRYQVTHAGTTYTLLTGVLDEYDVDADAAVTFTGVALDAWGRPGGEKLSTPLYRGLRTGDAIHLILDAIGWTGPRDIDPGVTVMPWWWEEGTDAAEAVTKLVNSEGTPAIAYVEGGTFVFKDRHHRLFDTRSTTSQATFTHIVPAGTGPAGDVKIEAGTFSYNHGAKNIVNSATFSVGVRTPRPVTRVWTSDEPITVQAGQTVQIVVQPSDPFYLARTPSIAYGDIELQSGAISAVSLSRTSGQSTILSITCSVATVITSLAVRGVPVLVTRTVQVSARDAGSAGTFGTQEWPAAAAPVWAGVYDAQVIATRIVGIYATYRPTITFTVAGTSTAWLTKILDARISDRVTVRNDRRGINTDFMVERLAHRITSLGIVHRLSITCQATEPVQPTNVLTFDTAGKGFNQGLFAVDGIDNPASMFRFDVAGQGFDQGLFAN